MGTDGKRDNLERYHRRKAGEELRGDLWYPALGTGLGAIGLGVHGVLEFGSFESFGALAAAVVLGAISLGMFRLWPWVRVPGGILLVVLAALAATNVFEQGFPLSGVLGIVVYAGVGVFLLSPAGREAFERAKPPAPVGD